MTQPGPVVKNATLGHPAGNQTHNLTNLLLCCQLSYGGCCQQHDHKFSIYKVVMLIK